jgi:hypothetical protein
VNHIGRPIIITVIGVVAAVFAVLITVSTIGSASAGAELSVRGIGFPVLLWFIALGALTIAGIRWVQRRRYVRTTTPEERVAARSGGSVDAHRPGDELDYGTSIEDDPK